MVPNPFQPRREFDQNKLQELSDSIRMYGVLQPLTVTRNEIQREDGTFYTEYELIAGERRLRASKLAGVAQVPVIIREGEQSEQEKLELAIIENLQREDLNAVDRALAFKQLADVFGLSHVQVAKKVGRSREYVSNSIRLLGLPEHILTALKQADLSEGHARTLLMLNDRPEEQEVIFREILLKKLSVREVERIVRKIATDKVRKKAPGEFDAYLIEIEKQFTETLGTRVQIQKTDFGGKLTIDYFSTEDLAAILKRVRDEEVSTSKTTEREMVETLSNGTPLAVTESLPDNPVFTDALEKQVDTTATPAEENQSFVHNLQPASIPQEAPQTETVKAVLEKPIENSLTKIVAYNDDRESTIPSPAVEENVETTRAEAATVNQHTSDFNRYQHQAVSHQETVSKLVQTPAPQPAVKPKEPESDDSNLYSINNFNV